MIARASHHRNKSKLTQFQKFLDRFIYLVAFLGPLSIVPQLSKIWFDHNASGVSALTWLGNLVGAGFWLCYGLAHKEKPIVLANLSVGILTILILAGIVLYS